MVRGFGLAASLSLFCGLRSSGLLSAWGEIGSSPLAAVSTIDQNLEPFEARLRALWVCDSKEREGFGEWVERDPVFMTSLNRSIVLLGVVTEEGRGATWVWLGELKGELGLQLLGTRVILLAVIGLAKGAGGTLHLRRDKPWYVDAAVATTGLPPPPPPPATPERESPEEVVLHAEESKTWKHFKFAFLTQYKTAW